MPTRYLIILLFSFVSFQLTYAQKNDEETQDVTGLWTGFIFNDTTQLNYRYEIAISENKGKLIGYSHTYFILNDKQYHGIKKLKVKREGDKIITEDDDLIVNNYPVPPAKGVHQLNTLKLEINDTVMVLSGLYATNKTKNFRPLTGYVHVERKRDYSQSALVPHLQELNLVKNLPFLQEAKAEETTIAVLKPMPSDEEEKLIVAKAKKQEVSALIKNTNNAPVVKVADIAIPEPAIVIEEKKEITKPVETVTTKIAAKEKPTPKTETVVKATPSVAKPTPKPAPAVAKAAPPKPVPVTEKEKPKESAITSAAEVKKPEPTVVKASAPAVIKNTIPANTNAAIDLNKRKIETIQAVNFKSDSLVLILYDNGEVDGDTVSVVMNGQVVMPKVGLSTNAVKKTIYTTEVGDSIQLIMYAESLGSLPPNTGLLIVYDGKDRYEIRFSGDMQKSSAIMFRRKSNLP